MSQAPMMPFYTDAYLADCHHLSTEAHGANLLILLHTWRLNGKPLPDDDKIMMRIVKAKTLKRWRQLKAELLPFFDVSDGAWRQKKLESLWADTTRKIEQNRDNGKRGRAVQLGGKPRKNHDPGRANAAPAPGQTLIHTPDPEPKPTLENKENDMMMTPTVSKGALEALAPVLKDSRYFLHRSEYKASPSLRPQVEAALAEIDAQLAPAAITRIEQIVMRLMLHFPCAAGEQKSRVCADYASMLQDYPEDLLCAAYQHVLKHHKYNSMPKIADFLAFMEPEMTHRRLQRRKLDILHKQTTQAEELA